MSINLKVNLLINNNLILINKYINNNIHKITQINVYDYYYDYYFVLSSLRKFRYSYIASTK